MKTLLHSILDLFDEPTDSAMLAANTTVALWVLLIGSILHYA